MRRNYWFWSSRCHCAFAFCGKLSKHSQVFCCSIFTTTPHFLLPCINKVLCAKCTKRQNSQFIHFVHLHLNDLIQIPCVLPFQESNEHSRTHLLLEDWISSQSCHGYYKAFQRQETNRPYYAGFVALLKWKSIWNPCVAYWDMNSIFWMLNDMTHPASESVLY